MKTFRTLALPILALAFAAGLDAAVEAFHAEHLRTYGYHYAGEQPVEFVNLRVRGTGPLPRIELAETTPREGSVDDAVLGDREVYYGPRHGQQTTRLYDRDRLAVGHEVAGPAIIVEYDSTVLVPPRANTRVDALGNLLIQLA